MPILTVSIRNGQVCAESFCNGCGQFVRIDPDALPAVFRSNMTRGLLAAAGAQRIKIDGLYFGPCCYDRAVRAWESSNRGMKARERNRGGKAR